MATRVTFPILLVSTAATISVTQPDSNLYCQNCGTYVGKNSDGLDMTLCFGKVAIFFLNPSSTCGSISRSEYTSSWYDFSTYLLFQGCQLVRNLKGKMNWGQFFLKYGNSLVFFSYHDDVIKWKPFPRYWPFVRGIHRSPVNFPHKGQWRGALMFSLICVWINSWVNNREAVNLRRHRAHYDVTVMTHCGPVMACGDRSGSKLAEVMVWCLIAPRYYLN